MQKLLINLRERSYPIIIENDILAGLGDLIKTHIPTVYRSFVITNPVVDELYGDVVMKSLQDAGLEPAKGIIPDGEEYKSLEIATTLYDQLVEHRMDRSSIVVSLGGGVVGDLAGFIAATFMRGLPYVQVPTTLLAQVDSSIGGKVAVNHPAGKNLIGSFYQPRLVIIDPHTLQTLPREELIAGMGEVIKHGMIMNPHYFEWLETNLERILAAEPATMSQLVFGSCTIKGKVVEADEYEKDLRAILNFGHTVGHALEAVTHYTRFRHGDAVAIGMVAAARLSLAMKMFKPDDANRLITLLQRTGLPTELPADVTPQSILEAIHQDKKSFQGNIKMILPTAIGQVQATDQWNEQDLLNVLQGAN